MKENENIIVEVVKNEDGEYLFKEKDSKGKLLLTDAQDKSVYRYNDYIDYYFKILDLKYNYSLYGEQNKKSKNLKLSSSNRISAKLVSASEEVFKMLGSEQEIDAIRLLIMEDKENKSVPSMKIRINNKIEFLLYMQSKNYRELTELIKLNQITEAYLTVNGVEGFLTLDSIYGTGDIIKIIASHEQVKDLDKKTFNKLSKVGFVESFQITLNKKVLSSDNEKTE